MLSIRGYCLFILRKFPSGWLRCVGAERFLHDAGKKGKFLGEEPTLRQQA